MGGTTVDKWLQPALQEVTVMVEVVNVVVMKVEP